MQISPYLVFNGNCEEAFKFYERCLGGKIDAMLAHEGTPAADHTPPEWRSKILHAHMTIDGRELMGSDAPPAHYQKPQGFSVSIQLKDVAQAERLFSELSQNGHVTMALQETFWAARFAMFVDRFGIPWMINCDKAA